MLNGLDLFSGIGGIGLALAPIWDDVRTLRTEFIKPPIDIIFGGLRCQDLSVFMRDSE
jgi:site-specific DNA-cytosine methylase